MDPIELKKGGIKQTNDKTEIENDEKQNKQSWQEHEAALMLTCLSDKGSGSPPQAEEDLDSSCDKDSKVRESCNLVSSIAKPKENGDTSQEVSYTSAFAATAAQNASLGELAASIAAHHGIMTLSQPLADAVAQPQHDRHSDNTNVPITVASANDECRSISQWEGFVRTFPEKLYDILESEHEKENESDRAMSWLPNGLSFVIRSRPKLLTEVLPQHHFEKCKKFGSFTRRLYQWGFRKIANGPDEGAFFHNMFQRGNRAACRNMTKAPRIDGGTNLGAASSIGSKPFHTSSHDMHFQPRKVTDGSTGENLANSNGMSGESRSSCREFNRGESESDDDENDDDQDYYDRQMHGPQEKMNAIPNLYYDGNVVSNGKDTPIGHPTSVSLSYDGSAYPPEIQALVNKVDASSLSLHSLIGVNHAQDESPVMMRLYHAASSNNFDRDALTEWLLFHHQKKLFLRTALLSDMVRTLAAQKGSKAMSYAMKGHEKHNSAIQSATVQSTTDKPGLLPQLKIPPQQRHAKQPKLNHDIIPAPSHYIPKQPKNRKPKTKDKSQISCSKKDTKKAKPFVSPGNGKT